MGVKTPGRRQCPGPPATRGHALRQLPLRARAINSRRCDLHATSEEPLSGRQLLVRCPACCVLTTQRRGFCRMEGTCLIHETLHTPRMSARKRRRALACGGWVRFLIKSPHTVVAVPVWLAFRPLRSSVSGVHSRADLQTPRRVGDDGRDELKHKALAASLSGSMPRKKSSDGLHTLIDGTRRV